MVSAQAGENPWLKASLGLIPDTAYDALSMANCDPKKRRKQSLFSFSLLVLVITAPAGQGGGLVAFIT